MWFISRSITRTDSFSSSSFLLYIVGTAWFKAPETDNGVNRPLVEAVKLALKSGYTHLDEAEAYENETSVGVAIKEAGVPRESLYITTKIGAGRDDIAGNFKKQCEKLGVTFVDLYLLHWPSEYDAYVGITKPMPSNVECWAEMEKLKDSGVVGEIGVSNYRIVDLEPLLAMAKHKPVCNQIEMQWVDLKIAYTRFVLITSFLFSLRFLSPYVYERSKPLLAFRKLASLWLYLSFINVFITQSKRKTSESKLMVQVNLSLNSQVILSSLN